MPAGKFQLLTSWKTMHPKRLLLIKSKAGDSKNLQLIYFALLGFSSF